MATRLDQVSRPARMHPRDVTQAEPQRTRPLRSTREAANRRSALSPGVSVSAGSTEIPERELTGATAAWLGGTFLLTYLLLPALFVLIGAGGLGAFAFWPQFPAFLIVSAVVVTGVSIARPKIKLGEAGADPVAAALLGGFGMWALTQNLLLPFALMGTVQLLGLVGVNLIENLLIGAMLASFTKRADTAFTLAAGFQFLTFVVSMFILGMSL